MVSSAAVCDPGETADACDTILVVEDEVLLRAPVADYLRGAGFQVFEAASLVEAQHLLDADTPIDLVFADVELLVRGETGLVLAAWMQQRHPNVALLITSGSMDASFPDYLRPHFLVKPYDLELLVRMIRSRLPNRRTSSGGSAA